MTLTFFCVYCFLIVTILLQYFAAIMPIIQHGLFYCGVDPLGGMSKLFLEKLTSL